MNRLQIYLYLYETGRRIPCSYGRQLALTRRAHQYVTQFFRENPDAGRDGLIDAFGEPAEFAEALLGFVEETDRAAEFRRKSWTRRAIVCTLLGLTALLGSACLYLFHEKRK